MTKIYLLAVLGVLEASPLVHAESIRRAKAAKSDDPDINRLNMNQNEFGVASPSDWISEFKLGGTRKEGKSGKLSKKGKASKSSKAAPPSSSVFRSIVSEFCDALTDCASAISESRHCY